MKKDLVKNTFIISLGKFSTQILSYLLLPLYTSILTTSQYGVYDFLVTAAIFLVPFITLLIEESMFRFLIDADSQKEKENIITNTIIYTIVSAAIWCSLIGLILYLVKYEYALVFVLYVISCMFITLMNSLARGMSKIKLYSLSNFILSIITLGLNILFIAYFRFGVNGLLYSTIIANFAASLFLVFILKIWRYVSFKSIDKKQLKKMIKYSIPLVPNSVGWTIINVSDRILVTLFLGPSANGIYSIANKIPNSIHSVAGFFFTAFKENASKAIKKEEYEKYYNSIHVNVHNIFYSICILLLTSMFIIFPILINSSYNAAYKYIPILIISLYYGNMAGFYGSLFVAFKETKIVGTSTLIGAIINIVINIIFIKTIGLYAAVISTLVSNVIVNYYRKHKIKEYVKLDGIKGFYLDAIFMIIACIIFYIGNTYISIITLVLAVTYAAYLNKDIIESFIREFKNKKKKLIK